jgi:ferritin-like metal-binding protein YciE
LVAELDGVWEVKRVSGALPPLSGVRKRIDGAAGETIAFNGPRIRFDVVGSELRYRPPFAFLVDVLEPDADGFRGAATAFGRTYGEFELRRSRVTDIETQLINHIDEAHALEQTVLRMLDGLIQSADDPEIIDRLEHHKLETQQHESLMRRRLEAHGASPSMVRQAAGMLEAALKMPLDLVRGERTGRGARDAYTTEHLEIASYELLRRVAERAGDEETAQACIEILEQERAMAQFLEEKWDVAAEQSLRSAGVPLG